MPSNTEHQSGSLQSHGKPSEKDAAGHKGVSREQVGSGKEHDPNNFANDRERASEAGRKGGRESHKGG